MFDVLNVKNVWSDPSMLVMSLCKGTPWFCSWIVRCSGRSISLSFCFSIHLASFYLVSWWLVEDVSTHPAGLIGVLDRKNSKYINTIQNINLVFAELIYDSSFNRGWTVHVEELSIQSTWQLNKLVCMLVSIWRGIYWPGLTCILKLAGYQKKNCLAEGC
jgi:hypothetical protein